MLTPFEEKIEKLEKVISDLEEESHRTNEELIAASHRSDGKAIAALARVSKELSPRIEALYTELDSVFREYEALRDGFERKLGEIAG